MSNTKKYYWLKLKDDFFNQKEIKKLRKLAGGDTFTIIYLKIQLLSIKNEGKIYFDGVEDNLADEIALQIDEDEENVKATLTLMEKYKLIEQIEENEYFLTMASENLGKESASAERVRKHREQQALKQNNNQKLLHCNTDVTACNDSVTQRREREEKEIELDIEQDKKNERLLNENERLFNKNIIDSTESIEELKKIKENLKKSKNNIDNEIKEKIQEWTNDDELRNTLFNYIQHRKDLKKPVKTINTLNLIFNQLEKNKSNAIEILNQSILNGWIGLFEIRNTVKAGTNNATSNNIFDEIGRERGIW